MIIKMKAAFITFLLAVNFHTTFAEGSKQLMPGNNSRAALCTTPDHEGGFATFISIPGNRLYYAGNEVVYPGFSLGYGTGIPGILGGGGASHYYFRFKDPAGNIAYGPRLLNSNAIPAGIMGYNQDIAGAADYSEFVFAPTAAPVVPDTTVTTTEDNPIALCIPFTDVDLTDVHTVVLGCNPANGIVTAGPGIVGNTACFTYTPGPGYNGTDSLCIVVCDNNGACDTAVVRINITPVNDISNVKCNGNGTISNSGDDYISFSLLVPPPFEVSNSGILAKDVTYKVTATQNGNPVAVTLSDGTAADSVKYFSTPSPFRLPSGTSGNGNVNLIITSNIPGVSAVINETIVDPGTCNVDVCYSAGNTTGSVTYEFEAPLSGSSFEELPAYIPKFKGPQNVTLTGVSLAITRTAYSSTLIENTAPQSQNYNSRTRYSSNFILNGVNILADNNRVINATPGYPALLTIGGAVLVPATGNWPGDSLSAGSFLSTLGRMNWVNDEMYAGRNPFTNLNWVTNLTGNPGDDDDMLYLPLKSVSFSNTLNYSSADADFHLFQGNGNVPLSYTMFNQYSSSGGGGNWHYKQTFNASYKVAVTYTYTVAPVDTTQNISLCTGQTVTVGTNTYSLPGTYTDTIQTVNGCDSVITTVITMGNCYVPTANPDNSVTNGSTPVAIPVLTNDTFGGDGPSTGTITITNQPANGTATVNDSGTPNDPSDDQLTYIPKINFYGNDSLIYQICDANGDCDTAIVFITVVSGLPPFNCADRLGYIITNTNTGGANINFISGLHSFNLSTAEVSLIDVQLVDSATRRYVNAIGYNVIDDYIYGIRQYTRQVVRIGSNGNIEYLPTIGTGLNPANSYAAGDVSPDGILYAYSNELSTLVSINLNASAPDYLVPVFRTTGTIIFDDFAFSPIDGMMYGVTRTTGRLFRFNPATNIFTTIGSVTGLSVDDNDFYGTAFTDNLGNLYFANNGSGITYKINTPHLATGPVAASILTNLSQTPGDGTRCPNSSVLPVAVNDSNCAIKGNTSIVTTLVSGNDNEGTFSINDLSTMLIDPATSAQAATVIIAGQGVFNVNTTTGAIEFSPETGFTGATVKYVIADTHGDYSAPAELTISTCPVPTANPDVVLTPEDTPVTIPVLTNDTFGGDGPSTGTITITNQPTNGTATVNDGGTPNNPADDQVVYTPNTNFNGKDTLIYQICDASNDCDTALVVITVNPVNDVPVANPDNVLTNVNTAVTVSVLNNDAFGGDGPSAGTITVTEQPQKGTVTLNDGGTPGDPTDDKFVYTPNHNYSGSDTLIYQVCDADGDCDTALVTITILSPLPVKLVSFNAELKGATANLVWNVEEELNIDNYEIMFSTDGIIFKTVGNVMATKSGSYNFSFVSWATGNNYYRIKVNEKDGSANYSMVRIVALNRNEKIVIYPNPSASVFNISLPGDWVGKTVYVQLMNQSGQIVLGRKIENAAVKESINVENLQGGVYVLKLQRKNSLPEYYKVKIL